MMMWWNYVGPLFQAILLSFLLASVVGLSYLWYRVFKGWSGGNLPACGECGYAANGLQGLICPNCEADLREVGIITPKQRGAVSPVIFILLWTLLLPGFSYLVSGLVSWVGPKITVSSGELKLTPIRSAQYRSVDIIYVNLAPSSVAQAPGLLVYNTDITIRGNGSQLEFMDIDPVAMKYHDVRMVIQEVRESFGVKNNAATTPVLSGSNSETSTFETTERVTRQALLDKLKWAGADTTRQDVMDEADELLSIIRGIPTQGLANLNLTQFTLSYNDYYSCDMPARWFMRVLAGGWVIVWIWGFNLYFRIRRKHQSSPA